jgi:hypothetical protein
MTNVKQNQEVVFSLKSWIADHLIGQRPSQFVVVIDIIFMLASSRLGGYKIKGITKTLGDAPPSS